MAWGWRLTVLAAPLALLGCGAAEPVWAPDDLVSRSIYSHPGPKSITLYTMINTETGSGAHTSIMINASQRVIFDPAGSFLHPTIPERNDVIIGINPRVLAVYEDFHARESYFMVKQTVEVSPEVAELAFQLVSDYGAVPKAQCTRATTDVLSQLPGFAAIGSTWFPTSLSARFAELPGATYTEIRDDDPHNNAFILLSLGQQPPGR